MFQRVTLPPGTGIKLIPSETPPQPGAERTTAFSHLFKFYKAQGLEPMVASGLAIFRVLRGELLVMHLYGAFGGLINLVFNKTREAAECPWAKGNQQHEANKGS